MVDKISKIFAREVSGLHSAAYIMGIFTVTSSLLALIRDRFLASSFGAGRELDIYYASFKIPDLMFISIGSLVSISVLLPLLAKKESLGGKPAEVEELSKATTLFALLISIFAVLTFFLLPILIPFLFSGFEEESLKQVISLSRILLLSPIILGFSNIFSSVSQLKKRFIIYALSPILYNLGIIFGIILLSPSLGILGIIYGVIAGAILHLVPQIFFVFRIGLLPHFTKISFSYIREMVSISSARTLALATHHIVLLVLVALGSTLSPGTISVFNFSYNIQSVLVSVIGVSYSLAAFSALSRLYARRDFDEFKQELSSSFRQLLFWAIPSAVLLIVLRAQIVRTILGAGSFSWDDTRLTAASLAIFAFATVFQSISLLLARAFYAKGETKAPLFSFLFGGFISIGLAFLFITRRSVFNLSEVALALKIPDLDSRVLLLSLAFVFGVGTTAIILIIKIFSQKMIFVSKKFLLEIISGSLVMGAITYSGLIIFESLLGTNTFLGIFTQGLFAGLLGIMGGIGFLFIIGNSDVKDALYFLTKRNKVYLPPPDISEIN